jgi:hypothetical protein
MRGAPGARKSWFKEVTRESPASVIPESWLGVRPARRDGARGRFGEATLPNKTEALAGSRGNGVAGTVA